MAGLKKTTNNTKDEIAEVVDEIEAENMRHLNLECELDEDGIARDIPLLAGYTDKDGVHYDTFSFREMTGKDEEAISKADVKSNGAKMMNVLVERCVVAIGSLTKKSCGARWGQIIREMLSGDIDYMAFKIRELSKGHEVEFQHKCPNCGAKLTTIVDTEEFPIKPFKGQSVIDFTLPRGYKDGKGEVHKDGTLRLPNGLDREIVVPLFKKNEATAMTLMLTRLISFNDGAVVTQQYVNNMSVRDRDYLENILKENTFGISTEFELICDNCGQDISGEVGTSNFL